MSFRILYGTGNLAKIDSMRRITADLDMEILSPKELGLMLPAVDECGKDPLENAKIKAKAYYQAFGMPVFSCDSGLYFKEVPDELQPGTHIRRVHGRELQDEELLSYYAGLAKVYGGRLTAQYRNAVYVVIGEDEYYYSEDDALDTEVFTMLDTPHEKRVPGYPLDSLSVDTVTGKYYHDMKDRTVDKSCIEQGYKAFWTRVQTEMEKRRNGQK